MAEASSVLEMRHSACAELGAPEGTAHIMKWQLPWLILSRACIIPNLSTFSAPLARHSLLGLIFLIIDCDHQLHKFSPLVAGADRQLLRQRRRRCMPKRLPLLRR